MEVTSNGHWWKTRLKIKPGQRTDSSGAKQQVWMIAVMRGCDDKQMHQRGDWSRFLHAGVWPYPKRFHGEVGSRDFAEVVLRQRRCSFALTC